MKARMRTRNRRVNSYVAMLLVTLVASFCVLALLYVLSDIPLAAFSSVYLHPEIDSSL